MHARLTERPLEEAIAAIKSIDIEPVKARLMDAELGEGWSREYADSVGEAYRTYLTMLVKYPEHTDEILLAKDVDEFWHTHILQTRKYSHDCQVMFGNYLHHEPHIGERTDADLTRQAVLAEKTSRLYQQEFGDKPTSETAWAGAVAKGQGPAWSSAAVQVKNTAWSSAAIQAKNTAWSSAAIQAKNTAWSSAAIQAKNTAWSSAAIQASNTAWSSAAIQAKNAAWSSAAIQAKNAAWSSAAIKEVQPAEVAAAA